MIKTIWYKQWMKTFICSLLLSISNFPLDWFASYSEMHSNSKGALACKCEYSSLNSFSNRCTFKKLISKSVVFSLFIASLKMYQSYLQHEDCNSQKIICSTSSSFHLTFAFLQLTVTFNLILLLCAFMKIVSHFINLERESFFLLLAI